MCLLVWLNLHGNQVIVSAEVGVGKLHSCVHRVHRWWPGVWRRKRKGKGEGEGWEMEQGEEEEEDKEERKGEGNRRGEQSTEGSLSTSTNAIINWDNPPHMHSLLYMCDYWGGLEERVWYTSVLSDNDHITCRQSNC